MIGEGAKIDNLVQIGHNVVVGRHAVLVAQSGVSGSSVLGDFAALGGQAGIAGHLRIGAGAQVAAAAGVMTDIPGGRALGGRAGQAGSRVLPRGRRPDEACGGQPAQAEAAATLTERTGEAMTETPERVYESFDIQRLLALLPHRYPFLLVDRIVEARGDEYGVGIKNVTVNEPHFQGHFPVSRSCPACC